MELKIDIQLTKKQQAIWEAMHERGVNIVVCPMSRQIGKTVIAEVLLLEKLFKERTVSAYISPSFSQGRKVFSEITELLQGANAPYKANASTLSIQVDGGGKLQFFSMESPTAIRGYTVTGYLILDEAAYFPDVLPNGENPYSNVIMPLTKAMRPRTLIISTPNGKHGMFYDLYLKAKAGEKTFKLVTANIYDDQLVTPEEIERIKKLVSPIAFRQEFLVEFLDSALTVFPGFDQCFNLDTYETSKNWIGVDVSTVGEDSTVLTVINDKNQVRQHLIQGSLDDKYAKISHYINEYAPVCAYIEANSVGEAFINEVKKLLTHKSVLRGFTTTNETKKQQASYIGVAIANHEIAFEASNTALYSEFGTYTWNVTKSGNVTYAAKPGAHDDHVMSLGIAMSCKEENKYAGINKSKFIISNNTWIR